MRAANPVLQRELLERWRARRASLALTVFLVALSAALYGLYALGTTLLEDNAGVAPLGMAGPTLGRFMLESLLFLTLALVLCVVPAYAAGQVVGERERRTLPLLQATLLRPWQIVAGKLGAAVAWLALLVVATAPLAAATLFLGGVTVTDVLRAVASILVTMIGIGGVSLGISAWARRTATAVVLTYLAALVLVFGTAAAALAATIVAATNNGDIDRPPVVLYANPFYGLADAANATDPAASLDVLPSPLSLIALTLPDAEVFRQGDPGGGPVLLDEPADDAADTPTWLIVGGIYLLLGAAGVGVAVRRLRDPAAQPTRRGRRGRRDRRRPQDPRDPEVPQDQRVRRDQQDHRRGAAADDGAPA